MASFSFRLMGVFILAALVLNISNYYFVNLHRPRPDLFRYVYTKYPKSASGIEARRSLNPKVWSSAIQYDSEASSRSQNPNTSYSVNPIVTTKGTPSPPYYMFEKSPQTSTDAIIPSCPEMPPDLGPELGEPHTTKHYVDMRLREVLPGGVYQPENCRALQSVAVIIAYRGYKGYLNIFMKVLHPFLMKQQLDYRVFLVEQTNKTEPFNRGKLLNVGFVESTRYRKEGYQCIILHDPHIVPMDSRNLYRCSWYPRQLATYVERPQKSPYKPILGVAVAVTPEQFIKFNGFSNGYWGNDADYYDLYNRINSSNYYVESSAPLFGKYKTLRKGLPLWYQSTLMATPSEYLTDGLSSLKYTVDNVEIKPYYTYLQVNIDVGADSTTEKTTKGHEKHLNLNMKTHPLK